jgi:hypothetical protein
MPSNIPAAFPLLEPLPFKTSNIAVEYAIPCPKPKIKKPTMKIGIARVKPIIVKEVHKKIELNSNSFSVPSLDCILLDKRTVMV